MATFNNLPFNFSTGGYVKPSFNNMPFNWGAPSYQQTANLQAAINVLSIYQESTYTYLKECPTIVIGYTAHGVQILRLPCIYGGIRDLGAYLNVLPPNVNLPAYLNAVSNFFNLGGYIKLVTADFKDLPVSLHGWDEKDLAGLLSGWAEKDLLAHLYSIPPSDLSAYLNIIEIRDLPASVTGVWLSSHLDLNASVFKVYLRGSLNLPALLHGWDTKDLSAVLGAMQFKDLPAYITPNELADLAAIIGPIPGQELQGILHGWDTKNLPAYLVGGFGPGDLRAYINSVAPVNLSAHINIYKGLQIPYDLRAYLEGTRTQDLAAIINIIEGSDLGAVLNPTGSSKDLRAIIIPKTILIRRAISISLMEHLDLMAMVNYRCVSSDSVDLSAYAYALMKKDLKAYIIGWYGSTSDNIAELGAYINAGEVNVQDSIPMKFVPESTRHKFSIFKIGFNAPGNYKVFDNFNLFYTLRHRVDLSATINPVLTSSDLGATLTPVFDWNYTELPPWIIPKTREVVINTEKFESQWSRFIEIMFDNQTDGDYHYFYVAGTGRVYRVDRTKHWTVWVKSFREDEDSIIDRGSVRFKYGFNMSNYNTIDEAIRDLIDRVSAYRRASLSAYINGLPNNYLNLRSYLNPIVKYSWSKNLSANLNSITPANLAASIVAT